MFKCQLTDSFNRCQYRSCINNELYCTAKYAGCGFRLQMDEPVREIFGSGAASSLSSSDSPASGSAVSGSASSGSGASGSGASGSAVSGSAVSGSAIPGSAVPGSAVSPPVPPYVRKPRWYESYYPDSRPVR